MSKIIPLILIFMTMNSYCQNDKLLGKWKIILNSMADTSATIENDAEVKFLNNKTVIIVEDKKKVSLNWEFENSFLSFNCNSNKDFPRFCGKEFKIQFDEKNSTLELINIVEDKSYKLKKESDSR